MPYLIFQKSCLNVILSFLPKNGGHVTYARGTFVKWIFLDSPIIQLSENIYF